MPPTITAFERSPDGGQGLARDTRVRWALEEVGQPYDELWNEARTPLILDRIRDRMRPLADRLGGADWLDGGFSAGEA